MIHDAHDARPVHAVDRLRVGAVIHENELPAFRLVQDGRRLDAKGVQRKGRFMVDGPADDSLCANADRVQQMRVGHGGAHRIGIGVFMADHIGDLIPVILRQEQIAVSVGRSLGERRGNRQENQRQDDADRFLHHFQVLRFMIALWDRLFVFPGPL